jgi:chromosome segregation ATPase
MRKALEEHISSCPKHPLSAAKDEITVLKESVESWKREYRLINAAQIAAEERVRELEAERNLLKSDLDKVERGYDEVSQRRDETVAMCDYLQNQVKDLENILEQKSRMVKAFMSELDKNQDENEFLHGRISELEAKNKRLQSELNKWTRPYDNADLQVMKEQSDSKSLRSQEGE